ncbi:cysteine-rich secretory protein LCCL domain-containing 1 [Clonorchis sinensis]|uniref:Cysteine-rich secretory protein LCCL domain-containing 1 n=1 Tax=Clonorchis sinensis TaxID=79923 RepID=G7Y9P3_CLOSI|nr:cysteine-rich secretory protein LCCL domain-containing 1 [Clonorchis sinensis]
MVSEGRLEGQPQAEEMEPLKWSNSLAREARDEAEECFSFKRHDPTQLGSEIRGISFKYENPVYEWRKRNNGYKFGILTKTDKLRHGSYTQLHRYIATKNCQLRYFYNYFQLVWANSDRVGCYTHYCHENEVFGGYLTVCQFYFE